MNELMMKEAIEQIMELAEELSQLESKNEIERGQLMAYAEVLTIFHDTLPEEDRISLGVDFDADQSYLSKL